MGLAALAYEPEYRLYPVTQETPDEALVDLWQRMGVLYRTVFYDGGVVDAQTWVQFAKSREQCMTVALDRTATPVIVGWLNRIALGHAYLHWCGFGSFKRGAARQILEYWDTFEQPDGSPLFRVLLGATPVSNTQDIRCLKMMGFQIIGEVPDLCRKIYEGRIEPAVISYRQRGGNHG